MLIRHAYCGHVIEDCSFPMLQPKSEVGPEWDFTCEILVTWKTVKHNSFRCQQRSALSVAAVCCTLNCGNLITFLTEMTLDNVVQSTYFIKALCLLSIKKRWISSLLDLLKQYPNASCYQICIQKMLHLFKICISLIYIYLIFFNINLTQRSKIVLNLEIFFSYFPLCFYFNSTKGR